MTQKAIVLFRRDLRIEDNPALHAARESGAELILLFVLDESGPFAPGGASRWWLHHSLASLDSDLKTRGTTLTLRRGKQNDVVLDIIDQVKAGAVYWNRRYDAAGIESDKALKETLADKDVEAHSFNGSLLREPWQTETKSGGPYKVFTPFWRAVRALGPARGETLPLMRSLNPLDGSLESDRLDDWDLLPTDPNWADGFADVWTPGEAGARSRLSDFLSGPVSHYDEQRNLPGTEGTSRLSPHLAFGEISPNKIWEETRAACDAGGINEDGAATFLSEIGWREFSYNLLFYNPGIHETPIREEFAHFPWRDDSRALSAWQRGQTGYPIVDAGMRQLWQTGWLHNRVRMIVGSFLVKNMMTHWREGERWFWDTLVDADPASNSASWQWVAGSGADAAPYFRIFNPVSQSEKFDPKGTYIRAFVPEISDLPDKYLHAPYDAPKAVLEKAGIVLGKTYPEPLLDLKETRQRALDAYDDIRNGNG